MDADTQTQLRLEQLRAAFDNWQVDGVLIGSPSNRRWLSGFTGSAGWLLVTEKSALLGTDFRYWSQAGKQAPAFELVNFRPGTTQAWKTLLDFKQPVRLGIESRYVTLAQFDEIRDVENVIFVQLQRSLERFREVKGDQEVEAIRQAAAVTDAVMAEVNQIAYIGQSERQLAWELERRMRDRGATGMAFPIIVAFGENSAMAHHQPGERALRDGDPVIIDMGAELDDYASDLTRSFYVGAVLSPTYKEVYELVQRAQQSALGGIRAGVTGQEADSLARDVIEAGGYGEAFGHSLGHGLGLEVHEAPSLSQTFGLTPMPAGSIITVEPGIYLPDWGGVRIEDLVRVTQDGVEFLSQCPKVPAIAI